MLSPTSRKLLHTHSFIILSREPSAAEAKRPHHLQLQQQSSTPDMKLSLGRKFSKEAAAKPKKPRGRPRKQLPPTIRNRLRKERQDAVQEVYSIVHRATGEVGGNGSGGPCYGELTVGMMQKVANELVKWTGLTKDSMVVDIGCGAGKPNLHLAQDPGVKFSFGIEIEALRTNIGHINVQSVLKAAESKRNIGTNCMLQHGDITAAGSFDPFTHVYQFDVAVSSFVIWVCTICILVFNTAD